ncbi:Glycosyltransferase family 25 protein [Pleurotus pulmonarius]
MPKRSQIIALLCALPLAILTLYCWWFSLPLHSLAGPLFWKAIAPERMGYPHSKISIVDRYENTLGIAAKLFVISLPRRTDRREQMDFLRDSLGLHWTYIDALDAEDPLVDSLLDRVRLTRLVSSNSSVLQWPESLLELPVEANITNSGDLDSSPLTCALEDNIIPPYSTETPQHLLLTRSRIACWHSHLTAIRQIAMSASEYPSVILEDDIDMERDIRNRLHSVWHLLPDDWDIVFLGHCWSDESHYPPLEHPRWQIFPSQSPLDWPRVHPSNAPKCTHAYALSKKGARRLWSHLSYPPFAYSRAIDQAFAWLIVSGRLQSYSIVPSLVVQRKIERSDIVTGTKGSRWKDSLYNGVFGDAS